MYTPPGPVEFQIGRWPGIKPILPVATVYPQTIERRAATSPRRLPVAIQAGVGKEARGAGDTGNRRYNLIECREQNRKFLHTYAPASLKRTTKITSRNRASPVMPIP